MAITKRFWHRQLSNTSLDYNDRELRKGWQNVEVVSCFGKKSKNGNRMIVMGLKELATVRKSYFYFVNNKKVAHTKLRMLIDAMNMSRGSKKDIDPDNFYYDDLIGHRVTIKVEISHENEFRSIIRWREYNPNKPTYKTRG